MTRHPLRLPWSSLPFQLFFLLILPSSALVLFISFASISQHQRAMRALVGERDARAVRAAAAALAEQLIIRQESLQAAENATRLSPHLFEAGAARFDAQGALLWAAPAARAWAAHFDPTQATGQIHVVTLPPETRLGIVVAPNPEGGWTAAAFDLTSLAARTVGQTFLAEQGLFTVLLDAQGVPLYQNRPALITRDLRAHPGVAELLRGESGSQSREQDGSEHVTAYSPVGASGWGLLIDEPWETVATPRLLTSQFSPLLLAPILVLALLALMFGARQIVQPLRALESQAARLAEGDYQALAVSVGGIAEIRSLQAGLTDMARQVEVAQRSLHSYIGAITNAQEDERRRLARDLHDDTLQAVIALKQRIQLARLRQPGDAALLELEELAETTIQDLRRVTHALRPAYLEELGFVAALEMLTRETQASLGIPVTFERQGELRRLEPATELALYRIVQEALHNLARHAAAHNAWVRVELTFNTILVEVGDDGRGFVLPSNLTALADRGHFGLLGLTERAELIGARLAITTRPGAGTRVQVRLQNSAPARL